MHSPGPAFFPGTKGQEQDRSPGLSGHDAELRPAALGEAGGERPRRVAREARGPGVLRRKSARPREFAEIQTPGPEATWT